jgi:hypothetical protein
MGIVNGFMMPYHVSTILQGGFKMTKVAILSANERLKFDSPPKLNTDDRALHLQP